MAQAVGQQHLVRRNIRRYALGDFGISAPKLAAYEDFETSSLNGGGNDYGWSATGIVYTYGASTAYEDFETSTLNGGGADYGWAGTGIVSTYGAPTAYEDFETNTLNGGGADFGWSASGIVFFTATATLGAAFTDLGGTATISVTASTTAGSSLSYQWYQTGVALANGGEYSGVTTSTLTITGVTSPDYTTYYCVVTCLGNAVHSNTVTLVDRATDWSNRVVTNGGAAPAAGTVTAARTYWNGLITDGVSSKIQLLNFIAPDNLTAAITPFVKGAGSDPWVNVNTFVGGDLTVNGLVGNASKYLRTGFAPSSLSSTLCGIAVYAYSVAANGADMGSWSDAGATHRLTLTPKFSDTNAYSNNPGGIVVASSGAGFYANNRDSGSSHKLYFANSGHAFAQLGSTDATASTSLSTLEMYVMAQNANGTVSIPSSDRLSFAAAYSGMSSTDVNNLYSRTQTLRTSLGGGFV